MRDVNIPTPNPFIADWLIGPECRSLVFEVGEVSKALYQEHVHKRTRRLAASARVETFIGGRKSDRWASRLIIGEGINYGPSHEFGTDDGDEHIEAGFHDLNWVLDAMAHL